MIFSSSYPPVIVGDTTLPQLILEAAERRPDQPALVDGESGQIITYVTLASRIQAVAGGLAVHGFKAGDVLAIAAPNMPQWAGVALAAMQAGGAVTGISPLATRQEMQRQLNDSGASILVTFPPRVPDALAIMPATGVREVIVIGEAEGATPIHELLKETSAEALPGSSPESLALLPYSSGTTGLPKGVMLTHSNLVSSARQVGSCVAPTERDTMLAIAPFAHVMGFVVCLAVPLAAGATVVTVARFEPQLFLELIQRHRVTLLVVPPSLMSMLARDPLIDAYDLSSVDTIVSGGAPLSPGIQRALLERFPKVTVGQAWGLTETAVGVTGPDRRRGTMLGSVGQLMPNTDLRIVDPVAGCDLGVGEAGELWVRGPQVMAGYLHNAEATAATIDERGWLHTGDLGYIDANQDVYIVDRIKELIKVDAYPVAPAELEALLITHPQVADVAVIRRPDDRHGEIPVAMVVRRGDLTGEDLIEWVAGRVAPYKRIRAVRFVEAIPRTPSGKILRRILVEQDQQSSGTRVAPSEQQSQNQEADLQLAPTLDAPVHGRRIAES